MPKVRNQIGSGITLCWLALLTLPIGLLAIGGGPCAGPRNIVGSLILLVAGSGALVMSAFGVYRICRSFRSAGAGGKALAAISALSAVAQL
jgi:hypothetical protein